MQKQGQANNKCKLTKKLPFLRNVSNFTPVPEYINRFMANLSMCYQKNKNL